MALKYRPDDLSNVYQQMTGKFGGIRILELEEETLFSYQETKSMALNLMKNPFNKYMFPDTAVIKLGNNHGIIYDNFINPEGDICDLWSIIDDPKNNFKVKGHIPRIVLYVTGELILSSQITPEHKEFEKQVVTTGTPTKKDAFKTPPASKPTPKKSEEKNKKAVKRKKPEKNFNLSSEEFLKKYPDMSEILYGKANKVISNNLQGSNNESHIIDLTKKDIPDSENLKKVDDSPKKLIRKENSSVQFQHDSIIDSKSPHKLTISEKLASVFKSRISSGTPSFSGFQNTTSSNNLAKSNFSNVLKSIENKKQSSSDKDEIKLSIQIIDKKDIVFLNEKIGQGAFGVVETGVWKASCVAVKKIIINERRLEKDKKYFLREISVMDRAKHPNIILLMAAVISVPESMVVMEYFESCNLNEIIFEREVSDKYALDTNKRKHISSQICSAIAYLHTSKPSIVHEDLKPANILVNTAYFVKLCDFGLSKSSDFTSELKTTLGNNIKGSPMFMAPELLLYYKAASTASDVWSLGGTLTELFTSKCVWDLTKLPANYSPFSPIVYLLKTQKKPHIDLDSTKFKKLLETLYQCFEESPENRITAEELVYFFAHEIEEPNEKETS